VGQEPLVNERITGWAKKYAEKYRPGLPVLIKLTPNVSDIVPHGLAAQRGGADGVSLINTIKSIVSVDIDRFVPEPRVGNLSTNGGYCGAAVKPIALHMLASLARDPRFSLPISGIGGVTNWRDAVEFILLGATSVQVCTEVMLKGYRIVEDMIQGLEQYMVGKGFETIDQMVGKAIPQYEHWGDLDLNYEIVAKIDASKCIGCQLCVVACMDGAHQCIHPQPEANTRVPRVDEDECVGCNLCKIVCPVPDCITMTQVDNGFAPATWNEHLFQGKPIRHRKGSHGW
jgi:dihydropyrimidine dehydrogenase (NAD+) subunit PreA